MKQPLTTAQAYEMFPCSCDEDVCDCTVGSTCSNICSVCSNRIWFKGSWGDEDTPSKFVCPYCRATQINPFPYSTQAKRELNLNTQTKYCWNCKHGEEWCDSCINYSGWESLDTKKG